MSKQKTPQPFKASTREKVVRYASLYLLHMAEMYIQGSASGESNNFNKFINWWNKKYEEGMKEINKRTNWDVEFKDKDKYALEGRLADIRKVEAEIGLEAIDRYLKSLVRFYWDATGNSNDLKKFATQFIPSITKRIAKKEY